MAESKYVKEFLDIFNKFGYRYSKWEVWNDFLYMAAASMANLVPTQEREEREQRYLSIINKYPKEFQNLFPELLGTVTLALSENPEQDFLGSMYHRLQLHQEQKGQFFTPYHISHFMAEINMVGVDEEERQRKGFITVSDPACGAGAMLIAFANVAKAHGINYQKEVLFFAQDIDLTAALMCYVQLSILGCPAIVIVGDSLVKPDFHPDNEIWYTPFYYLNHWRFHSFFEEKEAEGTGVVLADKDVEKFAEEAGGQMIINFQNAS